MEHYLRDSNPVVGDRVRDLRLRIEREIGGPSRLIDPVVGRVFSGAPGTITGAIRGPPAGATHGGRPALPCTLAGMRSASLLVALASAACVAAAAPKRPP